MSPMEFMIRRPIGTLLLSLGLLILGLIAYLALPVANLPNVDLPTIRIAASQPGAEPDVMAKNVAAPIERHLGEVAGITEMTSTNALGQSSIVVQFDLGRNVDAAARDVQAAINAAAADLPSDLPARPSVRKMNPNVAPVLILAMTSITLSQTALFDAADSVFAQRLSQVEGVAEVNVSGTDQPAMRIRVDAAKAANMGLSLDTIRALVAAANVLGPVGDVGNAALAINTQLKTVEDYKSIVVRNRDGQVVQLGAIARIEEGVRNTRASASFNGKPAVLLIITKQADANVIETVDRILALVPEIKTLVPAGVDIDVLTNRTLTIRASIVELQTSLAISIALVMVVVFAFLRRGAATLGAGITVPLSLAGTAIAMWAASYSINNISLMALVVSVGFVVDDAIVTIENCTRKIQEGMTPLQAALLGTRQIGFTIISISLSLVAAFIPLLFMGGIAGKFLREFSGTLVFVIFFSTIVSITVTPMIFAHFTKTVAEPEPNRFDRALDGLIRLYGRSLQGLMHMRILASLVMLATIALTIGLYIKVPKLFMPQDDNGLLVGITEAATDVSYPEMVRLQTQAAALVQKDPAVAGVGSTVGAGGFNATINRGRLYISLKPISEHGTPTNDIVNRLRRNLRSVIGLSTYIANNQDVRIGGRASKGQYQFTLWDTDSEELLRAVPNVVARLKQVPELIDVSTDREANGLQAKYVADRARIAQSGVSTQAINDALNNAFAQRQISTVYSPRNQYRIVLENEGDQRNDPDDILSLQVAAKDGTMVPLSALGKLERGVSSLVINHQGQFPAITISYNLNDGVNLQQANAAVLAAVGELLLPDGLHTEFAGDAKSMTGSGSTQGLLIILALLAVYIVLGVLYESFIHPLTILSTLPSAGLGALLALYWSATPLSLIAFIGLVLLIGIVKKNGILLIDFALEAERKKGLSPYDAIYAACIERFRPILMTTLAALFGALPLILATGPGSELRRPLGITIVGGLIVSQILTLYTTPILYLALDKLRRRKTNSIFKRSGSGSREEPEVRVSENAAK